MNMPSHYTITANLLAETTAYYEQDTRGTTHRAMRESFQVGGKGINVAMTTHRLGDKSLALCFPAGHTGTRCESWLREQPFAYQAFPMPGETRQGWVVRVGEEPETTFLGADCPVDPDAWEAAMAFLEVQMKSADALSLSGSVPGWKDLSEGLIALIKDKHEGLFLAVDTYGPPLSDLIKLPLDLVKINLSELRHLPNLPNAEPIEQLKHVAENHPVKRWVISDGARQVLACEGRTFWQAVPPTVREVSPVGCGDLLMGGLLHILRKGSTLPEALRLGMALASKGATTPGVGDFDFDEIEPLPDKTVRLMT